ncbi:MAG TPA: hypothetical protein PKY77_18085 [Phycisphaerae bacterium]|nr:hypothetical protein [Phycisphaerae bacterium]HRY70237.1 hypothetical protein [Phycisphaerae bacterium]HSA27592.1 hypothetical protein [Phycisphaerae bacterium]
MTDAASDVARRAIGKTPSVQAPAVSPLDAYDAVLKAFPFEGDLRVRHLWSQGRASRYRANWSRPVAGEVRIVQSRFVRIERTSDGLVVQDETVGS